MTKPFSEEDVVAKLRQLKMEYISNKIGADPAQLPKHLAEFLGYATFLYDHWGNIVRQYASRKAEVIKEESERRSAVNEGAENRGDRVTVTEMEQRITVRMADLQARRDYLEIEVKGATLHINGIQTLLKTWGDEAKGVR